VRARRTTPFDYDFAGLVVDEITLVDLYSVAPVSATTYPHFGNKTTIHTITMANAESTSVRLRELNCLAGRKLPVYSGSTFSGALNAAGQVVSGSIYVTSKIVDILAAVTTDPRIGNRAISDLDMAQIWSVQVALDAWNAQCGQFNHTFDSDGLSFEETLNTIANAAFCVAYRQSGKIRLALDRPQSTSVALFTHRNKKPPSEKAERITRKFANDSEYDGVELMYQDPQTEKQETIRLPLGGGYTKLKRVEVPGIRSYEQAWLRANRELNRLIYQRITIETEVTTDARALLPNARVDIVDNTRFKSFDGEVVGQSGLTVTLSRDVTFIPATAHSTVLMKRDGSLQSIACTAGPAANQVVLATTPAEALDIYRTENLWIAEGDSITAYAESYHKLFFDTVRDKWYGANIASDGSVHFTATQRLTLLLKTIAGAVRNGWRPIVSYFMGANGIPTNSEVTAYSTAVRGAGAKLVMCTLLPKGSDSTWETNRNTYNAWLRANPSLYDGLADFGADATMGAFGSPTFYAGTYWIDTIHPNAAGNALLEPIARAAVLPLGL
jgi:hypothetical protein